MDALEFFLPQHARLHGADLGEPRSVWDRMLEGLSDEQIRLRPARGVNSIAWIVWHTARVEDVAVNLVVAAGRQVLDDSWAARLAVDRRDVGVGMSEAEVAELSRRLDIAAARSYRSAVGRRTREVVSTLSAAAWADIVGPADVARAVGAGAFLPAAVPAVEKAWQNVTRAQRLATTALAHNALHLGEAVTIRGLAGLPLGV
jgi:hypothetical protein